MNDRQAAIAVAARVLKAANTEGVDVSDILLLARMFLRADEELSDRETMAAYPAMQVNGAVSPGQTFREIKAKTILKAFDGA